MPPPSFSFLLWATSARHFCLPERRPLFWFLSKREGQSSEAISMLGSPLPCRLTIHIPPGCAPCPTSWRLHLPLSPGSQPDGTPSEECELQSPRLPAAAPHPCPAPPLSPQGPLCLSQNHGVQRWMPSAMARAGVPGQVPLCRRGLLILCRPHIAMSAGKTFLEVILKSKRNTLTRKRRPISAPKS